LLRTLNVADQYFFYHRCCVSKLVFELLQEIRIVTLVEPIRAESLQKKAYDALRAAILSGELKPGENLTLGEIAKKLQVSTMPVREALRRLESQGMITFSSQKKITVTQLSVEDLEEFYWIRIPLECRAFARNVGKLNSKEIKELEALDKLMRKKENRGPEWVRLNRKFHMILYGSEKSPVLKGALAWLWDNVTAYLNIYAQSSIIDEANDMHRAIIGAIKNKDFDKASRLLEQHLNSGLLVVGPTLRKMT
jgi:DNA-binding GntR family transcriptional regulator